ncbi:MAG: ribonuclease III [Succinivibrionaceae bacterium]
MDKTKGLKEKYFRLEKNLGYEYNNLLLLNQALTHRSANSNHNERLEFLGDSILGMVIAEKLYEMFPNEPEGDLTRMRSTLVREATLAEIAKEFELSDYMIMGQGEMKSGGYRRASILADAVESILASIYLDSNSNIITVKNIILKWFKSRLNKIHPGIEQKDPKTQLQEYLQSKHSALPNYEIVAIKGADHNQIFYVKLTVNDLNLEYDGSGTSRRRAEQQAAQKAIDYLKQIKK